MWDNQMRSDESVRYRSDVTSLPAFLRPREERMKFMSQKIRLNETADVKEFVQAASKCDFDVDISYNKVRVFCLFIVYFSYFHFRINRRSL